MYTVKVINVSINLPHVCICLTGVMRMIKINFKVYYTGLLLTLVTGLYIRSPDVVCTFLPSELQNIQDHGFEKNSTTGR